MQTKVVNKYKEPYDVYIGRGSKWGNPYPITPTQDRETVIAKYREYILSKPELLKDLHELKGKTLGCFCKPKPCHGDILVELVNQLDKPEKLLMKPMKQFNPMQYLAIDIANHYGLDKLNYEERIQWVKANMDNLEDYTATAEEPLLYAKAVHALREVQSGKPTNHAVAFDAVCSGLQIMSALMRCKKGCELTGLIDPDNRIDAYTAITAALNARLGSTATYERKDVKAAIMQYLYGGMSTPLEVFGEELIDEFLLAMSEQATGAVELLQILLNSWNSELDNHTWVLPDNHHAYCPVLTKAKKRINVEEPSLNFRWTPTMIYEIQEPQEEGLANAANVVHSIDAYILRSVVRRCNYNKELLEKFLEATYTYEKQERANDWVTERYNATRMPCISFVEHILNNGINHYSKSLIQALQSVVSDVLVHEPFSVITIHDSFACHPNHMNVLRKHYNNVLADLSDSTILDDICSQLYQQEGTVKKCTDESISYLIKNANYGLT
ncbi:DUF4326 domain-containing protein [Moraxella bovoculi]|uniref:DUF4326 domain-containing protein n=1 Tax=Moraxella bovoculi TaxID=386891 RepID=UPI000624EC8B|nr:DUF4326 domain-containing protein [Moraxella bovoculi]AKG13494.1 hypothetical protein AAX11_04985 [Moraxella bovoculi]